MVRSQEIVEVCLCGSLFETLWEKGSLSFSTSGGYPLPLEFAVVVTHRASPNMKPIDGRSMFFGFCAWELINVLPKGRRKSSTYAYQLTVREVCRMQQGSLVV
ncbi:MAG: hypothetical protein WCA35_16885 [Kovacikia sp.]